MTEKLKLHKTIVACGKLADAFLCLKIETNRRKQQLKKTSSSSSSDEYDVNSE